MLVRDEPLASGMAQVYGRMTGKPGGCVGQGMFMLANGFLGTLQAYFGASPMRFPADFSDVFPFAQHAPYHSGTEADGSADTRKAFQAIAEDTFVALTLARECTRLNSRSSMS